MISQTARANLALSLAAFFWGTTFIAQTTAMDSLSPMAYGGLRFCLGALCLMPLAFWRARKLLREADDRASLVRLWLMGALISGSLLWVGVSFQQYGLLLGTTAGKAAFITSLYVVLVPIILRLMGQKIVLGEALGAALAFSGLYLLSCDTGPFTLPFSDRLVLAGSFIWAAHVLALAWLAPKMDGLVLGMGQALVCGLLNLAGALALSEWPTWAEIKPAGMDIVWGGVLSVALGFTLQVIAQKHAKPAPAAIIMQMESVVGALAGALVLNQIINLRMFTGMAVMLTGMLISQLWPILVRARRSTPPPGAVTESARAAPAPLEAGPVTSADRAAVPD